MWIYTYTFNIILLFLIKLVFKATVTEHIMKLPTKCPVIVVVSIQVIIGIQVHSSQTTVVFS